MSDFSYDEFLVRIIKNPEKDEQRIAEIKDYVHIYVCQVGNLIVDRDAKILEYSNYVIQKNLEFTYGCRVV